MHICHKWLEISGTTFIPVHRNQRLILDRAPVRKGRGLKAMLFFLHPATVVYCGPKCSPDVLGAERGPGLHLQGGTKLPTAPKPAHIQPTSRSDSGRLRRLCSVGVVFVRTGCWVLQIWVVLCILWNFVGDAGLWPPPPTPCTFSTGPNFSGKMVFGAKGISPGGVPSPP